jgi:RimJ/RimL family protein N-acetyltransferase
MKLNGYGVELEPLSEETVDLVRIWRNTPYVLQQMEYQEIITPEMQLVWFRSIDDGRFEYFIVKNNGKPFGLIHLADIDKENRTADAGLFIGEQNFAGTGLVLGASILLLEHAFYELGLKTVTAKVREGNIQAEKYNSLLGFKKTKKYNDRFNRWELDQETFLRLRNRLVDLINP